MTQLLRRSGPKGSAYQSHHHVLLENWGTKHRFGDGKGGSTDGQVKRRKEGMRTLISRKRCSINLEFMRLTTVPLTSTFLRELDRLTGDLIRVFNTKGGAAGEKIGAMMAKMENNQDINVRRDCVLRCLSIYLCEDLDTLVKEYVEVNPNGPEGPEVKGRVLAPKRLQSASNNSAPNKKDAWLCDSQLMSSNACKKHRGEGSLLVGP
ncbi:unnamed protein product [Arctogadus glacialis]